MKRRQVLQSIVTIPAIGALPAAAQTAAAAKPPSSPPGDFPRLDAVVAEAAAAPAPAFFSAQQYKTLERLCEILVPASGPKPGAKEAGAAAFLDFLIHRSPHERQTLYQHGLDRLEADALARFHSSFSDISAAQAAELLAPLRAAWTYQGPADEFGCFLVAAKDDVLRATVNSREWAAASPGRRGGGVGTYWYSLD